MSALADSGHPPKTPSKRFFEDGGSNGYRPFDFKHRKVDAFRKYPDKCGGAAFSAGVDSPSKYNHRANFKHRKVDAFRKFPEKCGRTFGAGVDSLSSGDIGLSKVASTPNKIVGLPIAAVPLRCMPLIGVETDPVHSSSLEGYEDGDDGKGTKKDNPITSLEDDLENLAEVIAKANDYLNDFDLRRPKCGEKRNADRLSIDLDDCALIDEAEHDSHSKSEVVDCDSKPDVDCDINIKAAVTFNNEPKFYYENQNDLINLRIVGHEEPEGLKVAEVLRLFKEYFDEFMKEQVKMKLRGERIITYPYMLANQRLKKEGKCIFPDKHFGHVPGIEIGDEFQFRSQLAVVGLHRLLVSGIDHVSLCGKTYATSVVDSGRYENTITSRDILIYSGQGGNLKFVENSVDQKLEKGNLALMNSKEMGYPVRVTFKQKNSEGDTKYVYDGLYTVNHAWRERDHGGKLVFKFELHRMSNQLRSLKRSIELKKVETRREELCKAKDITRGKERVPTSTINVVDCNKKTNIELKIVETRTEEVCIAYDISRGKEKIPIHAMCDIDRNWPPVFSYVTRMVYPSWYKKIEPNGCDCVDGCSDSHQCTCVVKNGGEIPYNENGSIIKAIARVHECGPLCKCPPTCMNRVSQLGLRYQLEIFKTKQKGWGVRSRDSIPSGGFVCEYIGEFLREKEADLRVGGDEYIFDICKGPGGCGNGYSIDAAVYGNIGRFFNHSCSPNMYAQKVIYDHDDNRIPHIMFYATEDIPPLKELTYHYNYKVGTVCDADWNVRSKECLCGSCKCSKRLY